MCIQNFAELEKFKTVKQKKKEKIKKMLEMFYGVSCGVFGWAWTKGWDGNFLFLGPWRWEKL